MKVFAVRVRNIATIIKEQFDGNQAAFSRTVGKKADYVSRWFTAKDGKKRLGEEVAREIEVKLGLPYGFLDIDPDAEPSSTGCRALPKVPVVGTAQLGDNGHWDNLQYPPGHGDGYITYWTKDPNAYALRVTGDSMRPRIKPGEFVIIEPGASVEPGDEVVVKTTDGRSMVKILSARKNGFIELRSINEIHAPLSLEESMVESMHLVSGIAKSTLYQDQ